MSFREIGARLADRICLALAPGKFIINPRWRPFEKLAADRKGQTLCALAAQTLIRASLDANATRSTVTVEGFSVLGIECGDWKVTVERLASPAATPETQEE